MTKELAEMPLGVADFRTDRNAPTAAALQIGIGGHVIGMGMGLEDPIEAVLLFRQKSDNGIDCLGAGAAGFDLEIQSWVDHRRHLVRGIGDDIAHRLAGFVKKRCHFWPHLPLHHTSCLTLYAIIII